MLVAPAHRVDVPALYEQHWRSMVRLAVLLVDDVASAEDVVQDAFVALHRNSDGAARSGRRARPTCAPRWSTCPAR